MIMVDNVISLEPGRRIRTTRNVTETEIRILGHSPNYAMMPETLIMEAMGQSASILFSRTTTTGMRPGEFMVLGSIDDAEFLVPVVPGDQMEINVQVIKFIGDFALVEGVVIVDRTVVARGKLGFAKRRLQR